MLSKKGGSKWVENEHPKGKKIGRSTGRNVGGNTNKNNLIKVPYHILALSDVGEMILMQGNGKNLETVERGHEDG